MDSHGSYQVTCLVNPCNPSLCAAVIYFRDVEVMRKSPSKGQSPPCYTVKGKGLIHAPPDCVLQFLLNVELSKKVDELLKEGLF